MHEQLCLIKFLKQNLIDLLTSQVEKQRKSNAASLIANPKDHSRVVALSGHKQIGPVTSAERGQVVTAEICVLASTKLDHRYSGKTVYALLGKIYWEFAIVCEEIIKNLNLFNVMLSKC